MLIAKARLKDHSFGNANGVLQKALRESGEDVINAWLPISAQGFGDPVEVTELINGKPETPEIVEAQRLYDEWFLTEEARPKSPEETIRFQFETTTIYVDAGFTGSDYLDEVANDWLSQDAQAAEEEGFADLAAQINDKINQINTILAKR